MTKNIKMNKENKLIIFLIVALIASLIISYFAAQPSSYKVIINELDEKKTEALTLSASATAVATAVAAIPNAGKPISDMLTDVASYTILITTIIFLEKFLLTTIGAITFGVLIPISCILGIIYVFTKIKLLKTLAVKLTIFGLLVVTVIPVSTMVSNFIEKTHKESFVIFEENMELKESEDKGFWDKIKDKTTDLKNESKEKLNYYIDSIAVMLITTCAIPLAVMAFMLWLIKIMFGVEIAKPKPEVLSNKIKNILTDKDKKDAD